jgi:hypothetical protein
MIINNRYLFIGSDDNQIKEFDLEKKIIIKNINKHTSYVIDGIYVSALASLNAPTKDIDDRIIMPANNKTNICFSVFE